MIDQEEIHNQFFSEDPRERIKALDQLIDNFLSLPDKQQAWNDLHRLTYDEDSSVRYRVASTLGCIFSDVPEKKQAWNDLLRLTNDEDSFVRSGVAYSLESAFSHMLDKQKALNTNGNMAIDESIKRYLNKIIADDKIIGIGNVCETLSSKDVLPLKLKVHDEKSDKTRDFEVLFVEKEKKLIISGDPGSGKTTTLKWLNVVYAAKCLEKREENIPLYVELNTYTEGSFYDYVKIKAKRQGVSENIIKILLEGKAILLIDGLDLLSSTDIFSPYAEISNFISEHSNCRFVITSRPGFFQSMVNSFTVSELAKLTKEQARDYLNKIQEKAKIACRQSKGTAAEGIACTINREVQKWEISNPEEMVQNIEDLAHTLKNKIADIPENGYILNKIELMRHERDLNKQYRILHFVIAQIPTMKVIPEKELDHKLLKLDHKLDLIYDKNVSIEAKLDLIQKELDEGFKKLDILSQEVGGKEGELIQTFSKKVLELTEKGDKEALQGFLEEVLKNENVLIEEIENSSAPLEEKEESKSSVSKIRSVYDKVKHPIKSFGKDVTKEIVVGYAAEEIVKLVFQLVSMATLGVPIPPQILNLLKNVVKEFNK